MAESEPPLARLVKAGDAIEHGGLAGAVWPDQRSDVAFSRGKRQVIDCHQPTKAHGQVLDIEQNVAGTAHQP